MRSPNRQRNLTSDLRAIDMFKTLRLITAAAVGFGLASAQAAVVKFDTTADVLVIAKGFFRIEKPLVSQNLWVGDRGKITNDANCITVQNSNTDANPDTVFNARSAAGLMAGDADKARFGFVIDWNSAPGLSRLVFDQDLSQPGFTHVVIRILNRTGGAAIAELPKFSSANVAETPLPTAAFLFPVGVAGIAALRRRKTSASIP